MHAGVEAGEVLVSVPSAGAGFGVTGGAVTLAARLCALADPGTVLVGPRAFELSWRGIEFGAAGQRVVRGFPAPVTVRRALGVARHHPERGTAFLGRERELDRLRRLYSAVATDGAQRVAVVSGDPGIGKSRLADALVGELDGALAVWARCSPYPAGVPYAALVDGLLSAGVGSTDELADRAGLADLHVRRLLEGLGGASTGPDQGGAPGPGAGDVLLLTIRGLARRQPVVAVVDDAEHANPDLRDLLAGLGRSRDGAVLWLILGPPPDLVLPGEHLHLPPLGEADSRRLLEHALPDGATPDLVSGLARRSAGNPLVLLECARAAREGAVGRGHLGSPTVLDPDAAVPLTVRGVLAAQLDRLPDEEKSAVQDMAVTSGSTWPDLLARLCPGTPAAELLAALRRRGLVRQAERPRLPTTPEYELRSPVLGEVAYASLPRAARAHKHGVAAAWLREQVARRPGGTVLLAQLAHHDERVWRYRRWAAAELAADAATRAVRSLTDLADRLVTLSPRAAGEASARGLQIAAEAPEVDPALRAELELRRAQSLRESWELEEALAAARAAEAAVGRPELRAEATLVRGDVLSWLGRVEEGRQVLSEARARFADLGDAAGQARALQRSAYTWRFGDLGRMAQVLEAAQRQLVDAGERAAAALVATDLAYIATERSAGEVARWCDAAVRLVSDPSDLRVR
ncbi:MAG TPA: AAA family ATPase, partial [Frankiaceae bacterium]|nr:AAA family ATPase [Frankiaceae bacterium]